jgi:hypothetical protein
LELALEKARKKRGCGSCLAVWDADRVWLAFWSQNGIRKKITIIYCVPWLLDEDLREFYHFWVIIERLGQLNHAVGSVLLLAWPCRC